MLRDERSAALLDNFFATWLSLDKLKTARPDPSVFPQVDAELLEAMGMETRLFVHSQVRDDRDAVEIWTAPYTFVNERLARHYGLSGISGQELQACLLAEHGSRRHSRPGWAVDRALDGGSHVANGAWHVRHESLLWG